MDELRAFTIVAKHFHPDDGYHNPETDVERHVVIAKDAKTARRRLRSQYGEAWELTVVGSRKLKDGAVLS